MELADTSAWSAKRLDVAVADHFDNSVRSGYIATCDVVRFELLVSTRDQHEFAVRRDALRALSEARITASVWRRALDVLELFAQRGPLHHRGLPLPDLLVAAAAESAELPVLHYDRHFELIGEVTGQEMRAIAPLGSL